MKIKSTLTNYTLFLLVLMSSQLNAADISIPSTVLESEPSFTQAEKLLLTPNNSVVEFLNNRSAIYGGFTSSLNPTDAELASLLGVSQSTLSKTDFIVFDAHGTSSSSASAGFESSVWSFSDGTNVLNYVHNFGNTPTDPVIADNAIPNAGLKYNSIFGTSYSSQMNFGVLLFDLSGSGIDVNSPAFTINTEGGVEDPSTPDITFLGVIKASAEDSFNFCCTPWTKNAIESSFQIITESSGGLNADFTFEYQANATTDIQINAYVNYLKTVKPTIDNLRVDFELKDHGGSDLPSSGDGTPIAGLIQPGVQSVTWPSGVPSTSFWDGFLMQVNHWYGIHSKVKIIDNEGVEMNILDEECKNPDLFVRIQVINSRAAIAKDNRTLGRAVIQISDGKTIIKSIPFD